MESFEQSQGKPSPRRELQGPRPTPLKVRKDSHKIKKPPIVPQQSQSQLQPQPQHRPPLIIYTISPKVIHTNASDFMSLVQRLTGPSTSSSIPHHDSGAISPAARFATIEKTKLPSDGDNSRFIDDMDMTLEELDISTNVERTGSFPGILSPGPSSLPIISPHFFSPPSDLNSYSFLHDISPIFQGNKNYIDGTFMPSPNSNFLNAPITSPNLPFDLFNQFSDF